MFGRTPWLGRDYDPKTRPVQSAFPTAEEVARTVLQEITDDPGYLVSFYDGDDIDLHTALRILAEAVLARETKT